MGDQPSKFTAGLRQARISELLEDNEQVSIPELAANFGVSEMTIRRDLDKLESTGQVKRTHGGAMPAERMAFNFDFASRRRSNQREKQAIAAQAYSLIENGHRIILDTGTTALELAYLLKDWPQTLTVITPSLAVASVLQFAPNVQTILLGGIIRQGSPDLTGVITEKNLDMFAVDIAFIGADGIDLEGTLYTEDMRIAKVDEKIRQRAAKTYVLADSSKIGKTALATNGYVFNAEALITDSNINPEQKKTFETLGTHVIVVHANKN